VQSGSGYNQAPDAPVAGQVPGAPAPATGFEQPVAVEAPPQPGAYPPGMVPVQPPAQQLPQPPALPAQHDLAVQPTAGFAPPAPQGVPGAPAVLAFPQQPGTAPGAPAAMPASGLDQPPASPFPGSQPIAQPMAFGGAAAPAAMPAQSAAPQVKLPGSSPGMMQPQQSTTPMGAPGSPVAGIQIPGAPTGMAPDMGNPGAQRVSTPTSPPPTAGQKRDISSMGLKGATTMQLQAKKLRIGEVLIDMGMIDPGQLEHALRIQKETGQRLGRVLISENLVSSTDIAKALARRLSIEYVELNEISLDAETLSMIPFDTCTRYDVIPIGEQGSGLLVAMADPTNVFALDDLRLVTGRDVRVVVASPEQIDIVLSRMISLDDAVSGAVASADDWEDDHVPLEDIKNSEADAPAVQLVNQIISQAVVNGVSDLHFEPQADDMVVRFRKDGVLQHVTTVPGKLKNGVTSRLKIMASLDISERRKPQDGRVGLRVGDKPIDLRVASLPTVYGEKTVLRVLDKSNVMLDMTDLGFLPEQLDKLRYCYTQPYGCLLVTGPTGSGKSTTLYGAVNEINDIEKNIITVEDPVEYRLKGINQVQVNNKAGLTFAAALKSILRCDPDIVMIGEMRDHETAAIGIEAALTGHLVLSTLHTNTAPGAITRLTEMGIEPYLVSSSVLGVLAQRLARRLCKCKEEYTPTREYLVEMKFPDWSVEQYDQQPFNLFRPKGCERCSGKGYKGRMGLHEVMLMSEEIAKLAIAHASAEEIEKVAIAQGMITLWNDGVQKIMMGQSTMEELQRVVQS
jgi:type IV pilus assembly protein PilB